LKALATIAVPVYIAAWMEALAFILLNINFPTIAVYSDGLTIVEHLSPK